MDTYQRDELADRWQRELGIEVLTDLPTGNIDLYRCHRCDLSFFDPAAAGTEALYQKLQSLPWYYRPDKWEYSFAVRRLQPQDAVLEVGCGRGLFLSLLEEAGIEDRRGLELNRDAVALARAAGQPVTSGDLHELATERPASFDAVCAFQVLEHVANPGAFARSCVRLLRPGGLLVFAVPYQEGYSRFVDGLLNYPPHHVSRWSRRCLEALASLHGLRIAAIEAEPLRASLASVWLDAQGRRKEWSRRLIELPGVRRMGLRLLVAGRARKLLKGQSIVACYRLPATPERA